MPPRDPEPSPFLTSIHPAHQMVEPSEVLVETYIDERTGETRRRLAGQMGVPEVMARPKLTVFDKMPF